MFTLRGLLTVSLMCAALATWGCKKEEAKPAADAAVTAPAADAGVAAVAGTTENVTKAKTLIDKMTVELEKMIVEVEAAGGDEAKVKAIGEKFKASADSMKVEGEELSKKLNDEEKKQVEAYGREKMTPLMGRLMAAMMKNMPKQPEGGAPGAMPAPGAAPAPEGAPAAAPAPAEAPAPAAPAPAAK
jgi:hypothetical protein